MQELEKILEEFQRPERAPLFSTFSALMSRYEIGFNALSGLSSFLQYKEISEFSDPAEVFQRPERALLIST